MTRKLLLTMLFAASISTFSQEIKIDKLGASPNPFTNSTKIFFNAQTEQPAILMVRNVLGKTIYREQLKITKGKNTIQFKRNNLQAGMYIYAIQTNNEVVSKRFVIK
ncbi:T9SS type A sorting domain-containing protein [Tenacibaculum sp. 190524A02b]|uniref:Por secretion system C-terminal sorting domain-containing protein n=1 Tax=Tenacibaculum vairaonense TaxID=3137860 RepID=A0ABP1F9L7_9FLAO